MLIKLLLMAALSQHAAYPAPRIWVDEQQESITEFLPTATVIETPQPQADTDNESYGTGTFKFGGQLNPHANAIIPHGLGLCRAMGNSEYPTPNGSA